MDKKRNLSKNAAEKSDWGFSSVFYTDDNIKKLEKPKKTEKIKLAYCLKGRFEMIQQGVRYSFGEGDLALVNCDVLCGFRSLEKGCGLILLSFDTDMLATGINSTLNLKFVLPFSGEGTKHQKIFSTGEIGHTFIPDSIRNIHKEFSEKKYGFELAAKFEICKIFLWILRCWNRLGISVVPDSVKTKKFNGKLNIVFEYVKKNYSENITSSDMAKLCGVSPCYFSRMFKEVTKKSFSEYLNAVRISRAEKMLAETEKNITEIAYTCGFSTSSYFIQQFKKQKGISPKNYQKISSVQHMQHKI